MLRINCPHCGERDHSEFAYGGDATITYPSLDNDDMEAWYRAVFVRHNPRGAHKELWHHINGCREGIGGARCRSGDRKRGGGSMKDQVNRLPGGGRIDRSVPCEFLFDGKRYQGYQGDSLASALLANGVHHVARSFKYHRPRGIYSAGVEEPNALVDLRSGDRKEPNIQATVAELYDGLESTAQNAWPSLAFDAMAINGLLSPIFAAGFYYKTCWLWAAVRQELPPPLPLDRQARASYWPSRISPLAVDF